MKYWEYNTNYYFYLIAFNAVAFIAYVLLIAFILTNSIFTNSIYLECSTYDIQVIYIPKMIYVLEYIVLKSEKLLLCLICMYIIVCVIYIKIINCSVIKLWLSISIKLSSINSMWKIIILIFLIYDGNSRILLLKHLF